MSSSKNLEFEKTSFLSKSNSAFIEQMYLKFINKDQDLPESWQQYFEGIGEDLSMIAKEINGPSWGLKNKIDIDELQKKLNEALQSLSNRHRAVVTMFDIQGIPRAEISKILKVSEGTVRSRLFYAHRQLQGHLEEFIK